MTKIKDITNYLESWAPLAYQEPYDNCGLLVGDPTTTVKGILICLDITENVLQEAKEKNCNLIIAHHPIIFQPIKKLTGASYVERCMIQAIRQDIAMYSLHTNLDNRIDGVNDAMAQQLGLQNLQILLPKPNTLQRLITFLPPAALELVREALHQAGAGHIGNYSHCSFNSVGTGTFQPNELANPYIGQSHQLETVGEHKLEVIFPAYLAKNIVESLKQSHPYEEPVYQIQNLENMNLQIGAGIIGELPQPFENQAFLKYLKEKMNLTLIRHSAYIKQNIKKVALCGGAGIGLLSEARRQGADAFITSDVKYHHFFDAEEQLLIADIGHYESEIAIKQLIYKKLSEKFSNIVLLQSMVQTNPVHYF
ncbi:MAG: Nif3-like dinuclear metal center hexameric protein [Candidatus Amoebophilus sp. 36-38]|nr:MAG: Nif3-like dinuclear metal center hexameric protein [Candidatus Amoebophilus sp. 36-38]